MPSSAANAMTSVSLPGKEIRYRGSEGGENESLKSQIAALESALELQERTLASKAHKLTNLKLPEEATTCFPYLQMLQLWRKKALSTLVKCSTTEKQLLHATQSFQRDRSILRQAVSENEAQALKWESRYASLTEKAETIGLQLNALKDAWQHEHDHRSTAERKLRTMETSLQQLDQILRHYKSRFDEQCIRSQVINVQCSERIKVLEERLTAAASRIALATELVSQKEVR
jgi:chromosome segregation ATPase